MAQWVLKEHELLLCEDSQTESRIAAKDIWSLENDAGSNRDIPPLCVLGIRISSKVLRPFVKLTKTDSSDIGTASLWVCDHRGSETELSPNHESDHAVINGVWYAFYADALDEIVSSLARIGLRIGDRVDVKTYIKCVKAFYGEPWLIDDLHLSANEFASEQAQKTYSEIPTFTGSLYEYQAKGSNWMSWMVAQDSGMILGDAMGLGKTIQVISVLCRLVNENPASHILIVCPPALVENWTREINRFTEGLTVQRYIGSTRSRDPRRLIANIILTTYGIASIDYTVQDQIEWDCIVLDEAQFIKNPDAKRSIHIREIPKRIGIAMTGTPFENHVTDVWSLMDFCLPGFLGTREWFESQFSDDASSADYLGSLIAPLLLRRRVDDIPNDLPPFLKVSVPVALDEDEAVLYDCLKDLYLSESGPLGAINRLKTDLALSKQYDDGLSDAKYEYLKTVADEVFGFSEKLLVFAESVQSIHRLVKLYEKAVPVYVLSGETPQSKRQTVVDRFSNEIGAAMLICNPTVAGFGLNITAANHVFHFCMQWNPAKIDQADSRSHRHGQAKTVTAYYPYYALTIEEYMWARTLEKRELADRIVIGNKGDLDTNELMAALKLSPERTRSEE